MTIALLTASAPTPLFGQVRGSERATLTQTIAGTDIVIDYARPSVRGRDSIFGDQVYWGEVWTPGANQATTLSVSKDVTLDGNAVPAGKYSVWLQVLEGDEWTFMLHEDTTLFHVPHPSLDEGFLTFPVGVTHTADTYETLTFDIQYIRATGGQLVMRWGSTAVSVDLGVDPGFEMTVAAAEAARYVGEWTRTRQRPADSLVAKWTTGMSENELADFNRWFAPTVVDVSYDETNAYLYVFDRSTDDADDVPDMMLLPKGRGFFVSGWLMNGELAFAATDDILEFEFDDRGIAQTFLMLSGDDEVQGRGVRNPE
jgi:hypothetical protein